jgi:hypothetical protein
MRRWLVLLVVAVLVMPSSVLAQPSDAWFEGALGEITVPYERWAATSYTHDGLAFTDALGYAFLGIELATGEDAQSAMEQLPPVTEGMLAQAYGLDSLAFARERSGQVGDEQYAASAKFVAGDYEFTIGYVMARSEHAVILGIALGLLITPVSVVKPYVAATLDRIVDAQPESSHDLEALLPQLDDLPDGYINDEEAPAATPVPSPTPSLSKTLVHLTGRGAHTESDLRLDPGQYSISFTCTAPTGSVEIRWGAAGAPLILDTTSDNPAVMPYTLDAAAVVSVMIDCAGSWGFFIMPTRTAVPQLVAA